MSRNVFSVALRRVCLVLLFAALFGTQGVRAAAARDKLEFVTHVDVDSTAVAPDGRSWATAFRTIQEGLSAGGGEVWVAEGVYNAPVVVRFPTYLYGGFAGTETHRGQRNWNARPTIIDGQNQHIGVTGADHTVVDGFTIRNGRPGMFTDGRYGCNMTVTNCAFTGNASECGGAMCNFASSVVVTRCTFSDNASGAQYGPNPDILGSYPGLGGAIYNTASCFLTLVDCVFVRNTAELMGGAVATYDTSEGTMFNCVFSENSAPRGGALAGIGRFSPTLANCTLAGNTADDAGAIYVENSCFPSLLNCILSNDAPSELHNYLGSRFDVTYSCVRGGFTGEGNIDADPLFVDATNGDLELQAGSPCIDSGINWDAPATDILGLSRPQGAGFDMGACEYRPAAEGEGEGEGEPTGCVGGITGPSAPRGPADGLLLAAAAIALLACSSMPLSAHPTRIDRDQGNIRPS